MATKRDEVMGEYEFKEEKMSELNKTVVRDVLMYFKAYSLHYSLPYKEFSSVVDTFLHNYIELSKYQKGDIALELKQKKCNYQSLLNEYIYDFLSTNPKFNIEDVPFVSNVSIDNNIILKTDFGTIKLRKASDYFKDTKLGFIFNKKLVHECFDRTLEFIQINEDFEAVVSYVPNVFVGGHYHAYAKKDDIIVDCASNAIYFDGTGELVEKGEILLADKYSNIDGFIGQKPPYLLSKVLKNY